MGGPMARVLVAHVDEAVCDATSVAPEVVAEHLVVATSDGELSLATLSLSERPIMALMGDRLMPFSGIDILRVAANDPAEGDLGRHCCILLSMDPRPASLKSSWTD